MMFGTFAEQRHFVYPDRATYQGTILNANMVAHAPDGLAAFLLEKTANLPYIIDPMTHAFQHHPRFVSDGDGKTKSSIQALAGNYGAFLQSVVGQRPIVPQDLQDEGKLRDLVGSCLHFQSETLSQVMASSDAMKYLDGAVQLRPTALVAPYFYLTETTYRDWLPIAVRSVALARELQPAARIYTSAVVNQGILLNDVAFEEVATQLSAMNVDGYLLWIDSLDEQKAGTQILSRALSLARCLRGAAKSKAVINLHGGYFSVLAAGTLGEDAFSGVTHGPEFGEVRAVIPVGGGIPIARYYLPQLHSRVRYRDVIRMLGAKGWHADAATFHANVCACPECTATINGDIANFLEFGRGNDRAVRRGSNMVRIEYPTAEAKIHCLRHYLQRKRIEYQFAGTASREQLTNNLQEGIAQLAPVVGLDGVSHLQIWQDVLSPVA